jgi:lipoate-protein ligase A
VYQDLGNTCFTFLSPVNQYDKSRNAEILTGALATLGVKAEAAGRNDLIVGGRKVSGSAYKQNQSRAFHHGTLLVDVDMSVYARVLNPSKAKLQSKGVASAVARVLNMRTEYPQVTHAALCERIMERFFATYGGRAPVQVLNVDSVLHNEKLMRYYTALGEWSWRFGNNPDFQHHFDTRFDWGTMDVHVQVSQSVISDAAVYSDSLRPAMPKLLAAALRGVTYDRAGIDRALRRTAQLVHEHADADYLTSPVDGVAALEAVDRAIDGRSFELCVAAVQVDEDRRALTDVRAWLSDNL